MINSINLHCSFATRAGSPQQREPITVGPYYLPLPLSTFLVGGNRSTRRKPRTLGRALTILFSHEDWVRVHIKINLTGDRTRNLRGEKASGLTTTPPKPQFRLNRFKFCCSKISSDSISGYFHAPN